MKVDFDSNNMCSSVSYSSAAGMSKRGHHFAATPLINVQANHRNRHRNVPSVLASSIRASVGTIVFLKECLQIQQCCCGPLTFAFLVLQGLIVHSNIDKHI